MGQVETPNHSFFPTTFFPITMARCYFSLCKCLLHSFIILLSFSGGSSNLPSSILLYLCFVEKTESQRKLYRKTLIHKMNLNLFYSTIMTTEKLKVILHVVQIHHLKNHLLQYPDFISNKVSLEFLLLTRYILSKLICKLKCSRFKTLQVQKIKN